MYTIYFTNDLHISHCIRQGSMYYSTEEFNTNLINDKFFDDIKIYDDDTNDLIDERQGTMCETLSFADEEIGQGYKTKFQFYYPTEDQQAEMRFKNIIQSISSDNNDITNIQLALVELYDMIRGMK